MSRIILTIISSIALITSCQKNNEEELYGIIPCDTSTVSFSTDIMPIINLSCKDAACHVQGGNGNGIFENYNQINEKVINESFKARVLQRKDMPQVGYEPLTDCQINLITKWLNDGAPNN